MTIDRKVAIEVLEQEQARISALKAWLCDHLGLVAGSREAEAIVAAKDPRELTEEQLTWLVSFDAGIPPGHSLSERQTMAVCEALL